MISRLHRLALGLAVAVALLVSLHAEPSKPAADTVLKSLAPRHPRLLVNDAEFSRLKTLCADGPGAEALRRLRASADGLIDAAPSRYEIPDGKRLLATSRRVLDRSLTLAMVYRLTGDERYAERLWKELDAAAHFKDWNPSHFLDTAEMTAAFAIGYDWLHARWSAEQRLALRTAIVELGLKQAAPLYEKQRWWVTAEHNWNQVCNGGMTLGALAVAEDEPKLAGQIVSAAVASLPRPMKHFAPEGAWGEGPSYWDYAVSYNVFMLAGLKSALGTDFGLSDIAGFDKAGDFPIHVSGPTGRAFNYADAGESAMGGPHIFWLATRFQRPDFAAWWVAREPRRNGALNLLWGSDWLAQKPAVDTAPLAKYFREAEVVALRSSWTDRNATFIAFKGGDNRVNHSHLDLGSFVMEALGERWAVDPGSDDYNLPGYFGKQRWDYYRLRAEGQNALVIGTGTGPDQSPGATAKVVRFSDGPVPFGIVDLTDAYAGKAKSVQRGVRLDGTTVILQDEIASDPPADLYWFMHTAAKAECHGKQAVLTQNGKRLTAVLLSPDAAAFEMLPAEPLPDSPHPPRQQEKHKGPKVEKLAIHLPKSGPVRIAVALIPGEKTGPLPSISPLSQWKGKP